MTKDFKDFNAEAPKRRTRRVAPHDFWMRIKSGSTSAYVIRVDDSPVTRLVEMELPFSSYEGADPEDEDDILMCGTLDGYSEHREPSCMFVNGFGAQKHFALAVSSVNGKILYVGTHANRISEAMNMVIEKKGGISLASDRYSISRFLGPEITKDEAVMAFLELRSHILKEELMDGRIENPLLKLASLGNPRTRDFIIGDDGFYHQTTNPDDLTRIPVYC